MELHLQLVAGRRFDSLDPTSLGLQHRLSRSQNLYSAKGIVVQVRMPRAQRALHKSGIRQLSSRRRMLYRIRVQDRTDNLSIDYVQASSEGRRYGSRSAFPLTWRRVAIMFLGKDADRD